MKRGDSLTNNSGSSWSLLVCKRQTTKGCRRRFTGLHYTYSGNRGYASWRSLTPAYVLSPAGAGSEYGLLPASLRYAETGRSLGINAFLTAYGRVKSGLKPAVKNRAAHGSEDCAARRVKTKADALVIGGQAPICGRATEPPSCRRWRLFFRSVTAKRADKI